MQNTPIRTPIRTPIHTPIHTPAMQHPTPFFLSFLHNRPALWALVTGTALALAACGGSDDNSPPPSTGGPVSTAPDRIEPYDPGGAAPQKAAVDSAPGTAVAAADRALATLVQLPAFTSPPVAIGQGGHTPDGRQHIGVARAVAATATPAAVRAQLQWQPTGQGSQRAALRFRSEGAFGVRLGVQVQALPPGSTLRFYGPAQGHGHGDDSLTLTGAELLAAAAAGAEGTGNGNGTGTGTYWSPDFGGQETTLELQLPAGADPARLALAVPVLSHFFMAPAQADAPSFTKALDAGSCSVNVACRPDLDVQSRSVARVLYVDRGNSFQCSGTLLNDARSSTTPYLLSAEHCIGSQAAAATVTTDWFYRASTCTSADPGPAARRVYGGATLLYASAATDTAFMRLNAPAPAGTVFAGSYLGAVGIGTDVLGLHQAQGGVQKLSEGRVQQFFNCSNELCQSASAQASRFLGVVWSVGNTEQGSSGSPLFVSLDNSNARYVSGQLLGGSSSCQEPRGTDFYGRFDVAFHTALKQWLKP